MNTPRIVLVTGANKGIGFEIAKDLAAKSFTVLIGARDAAKAADAAKTIGANARPLTIDVTDAASVTAAAAAIARDHGHLDVLINNAGVLFDMGTPASVADPATIERTLQTNLYGVIRTTQAMMPLLRKGSDQRIVTVSSTWGSIAGAAASRGNPQEYAVGYQISKAAVNLWMAALAAELRKDGISVNAVCPGWCSTEMGTKNAPRTPAQGAAIAIKLATQAKPPTGSFTDDKGTVAW